MPGTRSDRSDFYSKRSGITIDEAAEKKGYGRMEKLHVVSVAGNFDIDRTSFLIEQYIIGTAGMYYYGTSGKSRRKLRPHAFSATRSTIILVPLRFDCDFRPILKASQNVCHLRSEERFVKSEIVDSKGNERKRSNSIVGKRIFVATVITLWQRSL